MKSTARVPELDGFRGLAILLVVVGHTINFDLHLAPRLGLKMGELGVLLFFVLSGYLISGLLRDEYAATDSISLQNFYLRRALRLLPALAAFLIGVGLLRAFGRIDDAPARDFLAAIFYVRNIIGRGSTLGHLWSLSLEEQFYTLWPFLFIAAGSRKMARIAIGLTIAVMSWRGLAIALHLWDYNTGVFYLRPWFRFDAIAIGCWLALIKLPRCPAWLFPTSAVALSGWSLYGDAISLPLAISLQTALAGILFFGVVRGDDFVKELFSAGWLRWLGGISYSLYLWQQIFTVTFPRIGWAREFPINILMAFVLALLSKSLIEQPCLRFGRRFTVNAPVRCSLQT